MGLVLCRSQPSAGEFDRSAQKVRLKQRDSPTCPRVSLKGSISKFSLGSKRTLECFFLAKPSMPVHQPPSPPAPSPRALH